MTRYILHPGSVRSISDGQYHYIGIGQLRSLYLVPPNARVLAVPPYTDHVGRQLFDLKYDEQPDDIHCYPCWRHTDYPRFKGDAP